jgi:hypothetical protein
MAGWGAVVRVPFRRLVWGIPAVYALHVADQAVTGFAGWFSGSFGGGLDPTGFAMTSLGIMAVCLGLTAWTSLTMAKPLVVVLVIWSSVHLFFDPLFHIWASVEQHRYSPGLVSACLACLPLGLWIAAAAWRQGVLSLRALLACNLAGVAGMAFMLAVGSHMPQLGAAF